MKEGNKHLESISLQEGGGVVAEWGKHEQEIKWKEQNEMKI